MPDLSLFDLTGRKALVTGASRGIGRAIALGLARAGAEVAVTSRQTASLDATLRDVTDLGGRAHAVVLDLSEMKDIHAAVQDASARMGGIDILINNAGIEQVRPSLDVDEKLWDEILDTNLKGAFFCAQSAARLMKESGRGGAIVNLCSLTSYVGVPTAVPYTSSKTGLLGMTRALAAEWAPHSIRVNAIAPGYFRTALTEVFYQDTAWQDRMLPKIPQGRFGELHDLEGAAVFLSADASRYVTGQCLAVDGGFLAAM